MLAKTKKKNHYQLKMPIKRTSIAFGIKINLKSFSRTIFLITRTWVVGFVTHPEKSTACTP